MIYYRRNFVTGVNKVYRLAGNDWYAVEQDDDKVMLVDTDGVVLGDTLETTWSDDNSDNGQCVLNYTNSLADKYFAEIKYAIVQRDIDCKNEDGEGRGELKEAYMWPLSKNEFKTHKDIGGKIRKNSNNWIWTRTFSGYSSSVCRAWFVVNSSGNLDSNDGVTNSNAVAPAFNLSKSAIDYVTEDGEIILKSVENTGNQSVQSSSDSEVLLKQVIEYTESILALDKLEQTLPEKVGALENLDTQKVLKKILHLATVTNK